MSAQEQKAGGRGASSVKTGGKARILVVDDHPIVRQGLADLLDSQDDFCCCASAGDLVKAQEAVVAEKPDIVLLDLRLGQADGLESIKALKSRFENLRIVIISQFDETVYAERALRAGAMGYVMKDQATEEVLGAIRTVLGGQVYLSRAMTDRVLNSNFAGKFQSTRRCRGEPDRPRIACAPTARHRNQHPQDCRANELKHQNRGNLPGASQTKAGIVQLNRTGALRHPLGGTRFAVEDCAARSLGGLKLPFPFH